MKIIFIKKPYNSQPDGGDIYNKKIIEGLSRIKDLTVDEYDIKFTIKVYYLFGDGEFLKMN